MFDWVPFGSAGRIMGHGDCQGERVGQLKLEFRLPGVTAIAVATTRVSQDENLARTGVTGGTFLVPAVGDGMGSKGGSIVRNANDEGTAIVSDVVNAIGNSDASIQWMPKT